MTGCCWLAVAVAVTGCGAADLSPSLATPGAATLRVMTYNLNFGLSGDRAGVDAVASALPDVVLFQETTPGWETALVSGVGARLPHHRFQHPAGSWAADGMGVLSRWPIASIDTLTAGGGPFFAWRVVIAAPTGPIQILNLHLRPPMSDSGSWLVGYFSTRGVREREARTYLAAIDPQLPTLVVGDFNEEDDGRAIAVFRRGGFTSVLPRFQPAAQTWHWPIGKLGTLRLRLDHILADNHWRPLNADVSREGRSDHFAVWADLERVP